jgi:hypothetical protein
MTKFALTIVCTFLFLITTQAQEKIIDARKTDACLKIKEALNNKPKEVLFGIDIEENKDLTFGISDREYLKEIIVNPNDGLMLDIVSKELFDCEKPKFEIGNIHNGIWTKPMYKKEIFEKLVPQLGNRGSIFFKDFKGYNDEDELEGNLIFLVDNKVCYYQQFTNIPQSNWELLPMGLFADEIQNKGEIWHEDQEGPDTFFYSKLLKFEILFEKNKAVYQAKDLKVLYYSLNLKGFDIKKLEIRAYSSIEGSTEINTDLQIKRAQSIINALQTNQKKIIATEITTAENWLDFYTDIADTDADTLKNYSENEIKEILKNSKNKAEIEEILKNHRKGLITIYLEKRTGFQAITNEILIKDFERYVEQKNVDKLVLIQKELMERIADKKAPKEYLNRLEVPLKKEFAFLINDRLVFEYNMDFLSNKTVLEKMKQLLKVDPENPKVNYNIVALSIKIEDFSKIDLNKMMFNINNLKGLGIDNSLVRRMKINFHIRKADADLNERKYNQKDISLAFIAKHYTDLNLDDEDLLTVAVLLSYYSQDGIAKLILKDRTDKIDVNEDLLFYYINLLFFQDEGINSMDYEGVVRNAIIIDKTRFCMYFDPINQGGASFQLLADQKLKELYCIHCNK